MGRVFKGLVVWWKQSMNEIECESVAVVAQMRGGHDYVARYAYKLGEIM